MHYPPRRHPYSPEGYFDRPFMRNHFDDPYLYGDNIHGTKRPLFMRVGFHIPAIKKFCIIFFCCFSYHLELCLLYLGP